MAGNSKRTIIHIESTAGTGYRYTLTKVKNFTQKELSLKNLIQLLKNMSFSRKQINW